jgi:MYXO-CTERM domain-containing protein
MALGGVLASSAHASGPAEPTSPRIFGGQEASTCQWPTTALVTASGSLCSSVLIHPELVVTAAHCIDLDDPPFDIKFGELHYSPEQKVKVDFCKRSPNYSGEVGGYDIAFCKLAEPVEEIPPTPVPYGCETSIVQYGWPVTIVGFGRPDDENQAGTKRFAETSILSPVNDDTLEVMIGENGSTACNGDSGGPAYVQYPTDGSWHAIAIVSGGVPGCGLAGRSYVLIEPWIPWMELASGLDLTPCHDRDGTWNPGPRCGRFAIDPLQDGVSWGDWCASAVSGPNETCGEPYQGELYDPFPPGDSDPAGCECRLGRAQDGIGWGLAWLGLIGLTRRRR